MNKTYRIEVCYTRLWLQIVLRNLFFDVRGGKIKKRAQFPHGLRDPIKNTRASVWIVL
jgi:hypothetical protein